MPSTSVAAREAIIATTSSAICTMPTFSSAFNTTVLLSVSFPMKNTLLKKHFKYVPILYHNFARFAHMESKVDTMSLWVNIIP